MRTITINGKTVQLETGKFPAPIATIKGRPKSDLRLLLEAMQAGESALLPPNVKDKSSFTQVLNAAGKGSGNRFSYRTEADGVRIYCIAREIAPTPEREVRPMRRPTIMARAANGLGW